MIRKLWLLNENVRKHPNSVKFQSDVGKRIAELLDIANSAVPPKEAGDRAFLQDQRMARRLLIEVPDRATTERWRRQELRRSRAAGSAATPAAPTPPVTEEASPVTASDTGSISDKTCLTVTANPGWPRHAPASVAVPAPSTPVALGSLAPAQAQPSRAQLAPQSSK